jgi:hypothetical protein
LAAAGDSDEVKPKKRKWWKKLGSGLKNPLTTIGGAVLAAGMTIATNPEAAGALVSVIPGVAVALPWIKLAGTVMGAGGAVAMGTAAKDAED